MAVSDEELRDQFSGALSSLNAQPIIGLNAIASVALIVWNAHVVQKAKRAQVDNLVLGNRPKRSVSERYKYARRLAAIWWFSELPEEARSANSDDVGRQAISNWLASHSVYSVADLDNFLSGRPTRLDSGQVEHLSGAIAAAVRNSERQPLWYDYTPADFANAIVKKLTIEQARDFCRAATDALTDRENGSEN